MDKKNKSNLFFKMIAGIAVLVAFYHINRFFFPPAGESAFRHLVFVGINIICIFGLLKRPKWFTWFFGLLLLQQLFSHGSHLANFWKIHHRPDLIDIVVVAGMPFIFAALIKNRNAGS